MTEIQQTNIAVANFIIGELHKDKPFNLVLDAGETGALYHMRVSHIICTATLYENWKQL